MGLPVGRKKFYDRFSRFDAVRPHRMTAQTALCMRRAGKN